MIQNPISPENGLISISVTIVWILTNSSETTAITGNLDYHLLRSEIELGLIYYLRTVVNIKQIIKTIIKNQASIYSESSIPQIINN